jgi:hypothetical protein
MIVWPWQVKPECSTITTAQLRNIHIISITSSASLPPRSLTKWQIVLTNICINTVTDGDKTSGVCLAPTVQTLKKSVYNSSSNFRFPISTPASSQIHFRVLRQLVYCVACGGTFNGLHSPKKAMGRMRKQWENLQSWVWLLALSLADVLADVWHEL